MTVTDPTWKYQRDPNLIAAEMDGDTVMMSIEHGQYYGIGGVGSRIWELLEQPVPLAALVQTICAEFEVDEATCQIDVANFIDQLQSYGLVNRIAN